MAADRGLTTVDTIEALLAMKLDAVLIATPTAMHCGQALAAMAAGKHVMIEKPMALDYEQARQLTTEASGRGLVLSVFHNRRWDVDYLTVAAAVRAGRIGRVFNVESRLGQWGSCVGPAAPQWNPNWRNEAAFGGGALYDWGSHFLDQLWQLLLPAKPVRVFAQLRGNMWTRDCDDLARVLVDFDNGCTGMVEINTTTARPLPRWHLDGTLGSMEGPASSDYDTRKWADLTVISAADGSSKSLPLAAGGLSETRIWEQFAAAVGGLGPAAVTAASVLPTMALLDAAQQSARAGQAVDVALKTDRVW